MKHTPLFVAQTQRLHISIDTGTAQAAHTLCKALEGMTSVHVHKILETHRRANDIPEPESLLELVHGLMAALSPQARFAPSVAVLSNWLMANFDADLAALAPQYACDSFGETVMEGLPFSIICPRHALMALLAALSIPSKVAPAKTFARI